MKKTITKCLCVLMTVAMLATVFCLPTSAEQTLSPDSRYGGNLNAGDHFVGSFTPSTTGRYILESTGSEDTFAVLYDANYNVIASDDDSGNGYNFRLCNTLTAGRKYYYQVGFRYDTTSGWISFDFYDVDTITSNMVYEVTLATEASAWNKIVPTKTSLYTFESVTEEDTYIVLYDSQMNVIAEDDDSGYYGSYNYKLTAKLTANKTYYVRSYFLSDYVEGTLKFHVYDGTYSLTPLDTETIYLNPGDTAWASYTPSRTTCYTIFSHDSGDLYVTMYDANGKVIAQNDDYDDGEFMLSRRLTAGQTYYYEVRFYDSTDSGDIYFTFFEEQYPDVPASAWFYDAVSYVSERGFMTGYKSGAFGAVDNLQRQDFVVTLARITGADLSAYQDDNGGLSDVTPGSYYAPAVAWAVDNGIVTGYQNGKFGVGNTITREQVCTILYRASGSPAVGDPYETLGDYPDAHRVSSYATDAMAWAIQNGIISGMQNGKLAPASGASRAQIATILMRMDQNGMFGE